MSDSLKIGELAKRTGSLVETIRYMLALILVPVPHSLYGNFGIHCLYV